MLISGHADHRRATLEVTGDTLLWRAAENVATTIHEVKRATYGEHRLSIGGIALAALSIAWIASESAVVGACGLAAAAGLQAWRATRPHRRLRLEVGDRCLVMRVAAGSSGDARALATRIEHARSLGVAPSRPPALP